MKLKKPELPKYKTTLPISGKEVEYRPYTVKEEKIILMAASTENAEEIQNAAMQVVENCTSVDLLKLHPVDVEWLYIKLYIASVSRHTTVEFPVDCGTEPYESEDGKLIECPGFISVKVDLEKTIELQGAGYLEENGYTRRGDGWLVPFTDASGIVFKLLSTTKDDQYEVLFDAFECLFDDEEVTTKGEVTLDEFREWIDELPKPIADKIDFLFRFQPFLAVKMKGNCPVCGKEHEREVSGVLDFLG